MWAYIARRLLLGILTLLGVTLVTFYIVRVAPDDLAILILIAGGSVSDPMALEWIREELGLNDPLYVQYFNQLFGLLTLDFGRSYFYDTDMSTLLVRKWPLSLQLGSMAIAVGGTLGIAGGIIAALKPDGLVDNLVRGIAVLGISMPTFWSGMMLILILVRTFDWIPQQGYIPFREDPFGSLAQLIWPALVVGLGMIMGTVLRIMRASLFEAMSSDYVRLARAKGMRERIIVVRHALPNALIPTVTVIGAFVPITLVGLILTEQVFGLPGMGHMLVDSINQRDYPVLQTVITLSAIIVVLTNIVVDLLYVRLDPRIRYWTTGP